MFIRMRVLPVSAVTFLLALSVGCGSDTDPVTDLSAGDNGVDVADVATDHGGDAPATDVPGDTDPQDVWEDVVLPEPPDLAPLVNQFIGTRGYGNVFVGAAVPHGMVKLGPNTIVREGSMTGYDYDNDKLKGFVHSHLEGPGGSGNGYNRLLVMPVTGNPGTEEGDYASEFSHDNEVALPGYYSVTLDKYGIRAELTASRLVGFHRYTFPAAERSAILLDLRTNLGTWLESDFNVVGTDTVEGWARYQTNPLINTFVEAIDPGTGIATIYFSLKMDRNFESTEEWSAFPKKGVSMVFPTAEGDVVELRAGISYISVDQARANREEMAGSTFDQVAADARLKWNRLLSRVELETDDADFKTKFYTAMYHVFLAPADYTEGNGFFSGADGKGQTVMADGWRYYTDDWCLWDTARTSHPLFTVLEPEVNSDMIQSLVHTYEAGGWMQKCTWNALGDSRCMTANMQFCAVVDTYVKGYRNFDVAKAYEAMKKGSMQDSENPMPDGMCGYFNRGTPPEYVENGFISMQCDIDQSASMTLEHAHNDWCVAKMAEDLGHVEDARYFFSRSESWKNHFNAEAGFMVPKNRDGTWLDGFKPENKAGFCEADSWKYTWSVPHDPCGLKDLMGGNEPFVTKLDRLFSEGHYAMDNEPDFHVPWMYNFADAPHRTQVVVRDLLDNEFDTGPEGLPGNDDAGAMSAWIVFAAIGFYPMTPCDGSYQLHAPAVPKSVIHINPERRRGVDFEIVAEGLSDQNRYIQSATLDGLPYESTKLEHSRLMKGGRLVFVMGPQPSDWGKSQCGK